MNLLKNRFNNNNAVQRFKNKLKCGFVDEIIIKKKAKMKFFAIGLISAIFASSCNAASMGNLRSLDVENCRFHNAAGECTECIFRYILDDGACRAVSDQCKTWNATSGDC